MHENLTIKDMPAQERPYEKCMRYGAQALSDAELIAVIIRTGSSRERSIDLACRVLSAQPDGLLNLHTMSIEELMQIHGIGRVKSVQLKCTAEIARRMAGCRRRERVALNSPQTIADYYMERMRHLDKEHLLLVLFDTRNHLIGDRTLTIGTATASLAVPADIFRAALLDGADSIVLLHNHPSGDPAPSEQDICVTDTAAASGKLLGIRLMDHIIIGDNCYYSFAEHGFGEKACE